MTRRARPWLFVAIALVGIVGAGLYGSRELWSNGGAGSCPSSSARLPAMRSLTRGEVAAFEVAGAARPAPPLAFKRPDGSPASLADFEGRTVLLNLWATWCEPCRREMPALDALQGRLGGAAFEVVAVNMDTRNLDRARTWLADNHVSRLAFYSDPQARIFQDLRRAGLSDGLPTTLLVGPDGCGLGRLSGWAEWASPDGEALVRAAMP